MREKASMIACADTPIQPSTSEVQESQELRPREPLRPPAESPSFFFFPICHFKELAWNEKVVTLEPGSRGGGRTAASKKQVGASAESRGGQCEETSN
jgi:hypothetical protein